MCFTHFALFADFAITSSTHTVYSALSKTINTSLSYLNNLPSLSLLLTTSHLQPQDDIINMKAYMYNSAQL